MHMPAMKKLQIYSHMSCGEIWSFSTAGMCMMWRMFLNVDTLCFLLKNWFCRDLRCLSQNLFWRDLHTFVWRKIKTKIAYVEKKWQIWGMPPLAKASFSNQFSPQTNLTSSSSSPPLLSQARLLALSTLVWCPGLSPFRRWVPECPPTIPPPPLPHCPYCSTHTP